MTIEGCLDLPGGAYALHKKYMGQWEDVYDLPGGVYDALGVY